MLSIFMGKVGYTTMANKMTDIQVKEMCNNAKHLGFRPERLILLNQRLEEWSRNNITPSIAVRILRHGELAFEGAYGILGPGKAADSLMADAIFPVCSLTKPVTGTILSIMQEEGLLDLNEPVRLYLPEFTGDEDSLIRIWHLLTHSSGLIDEDLSKNFDKYITEKLGIAPVEDDAPEEAENEMFLKIRDKLGLPYMEPGEDMRSNTYRTVILMTPPTHKPQKVMSYCNTGLRLAMDIVKSVSGRSVDEYLTEKIFAPCKMVDSHFLFPQEKLSRYVTRGPEFIGSNWLNSGILNSDNGAGGLKSTVHDMTNLGQMYLNRGVYDGKRVLSTASVREITSDHNQQVSASIYHGETFESTWGLGWNVKGTKTDDAGMLRTAGSFEHGGFASTKLLCDPEADIVAAYFTVCMEDKAINAAKFNNMVIGAIE